MSCMSGRGRSGTLGAIIAAAHAGINSRSDPHQAEMDAVEIGVGDLRDHGPTDPAPPPSSLPPPSPVSVLVDLIVGLRANRDGLVELPLQFAYVRRILGL